MKFPIPATPNLSGCSNQIKAAIVSALIASGITARADFSGSYALPSGSILAEGFVGAASGQVFNGSTGSWVVTYEVGGEVIGYPSLNTVSVPASVGLSISTEVQPRPPAPPFGPQAGLSVAPFEAMVRMQIAATAAGTITLHASSAANAFAFDAQNASIAMTAGGDVTLDVTVGEIFGFGAISSLQGAGAPGLLQPLADPVVDGPAYVTVSMTFQPVPETMPSVMGLSSMLALGLLWRRCSRR